jgi:hypothetical protein
VAKENEFIEIVDEKVPDVVEIQEEIVGRKVSEIAEEATRDAIEDPIDEVCSDKEYSLKAIIPQFDGTFDEEVVYTFVSDFHKEDIEYTIEEVMPEDVETKLVSVARIGGFQSADQLCKLLIKIPPGKNFIWPMMTNSQSEVIKEIKTVPHFDPA